MSDRVLWIWLSLACGPGSRAYNKLFASFSTLREIYDAPRERLMEVDGITDRIADALADKDLTRAKDILSFCMQKNWYVLTYGDKGYPKRLKTLVDPPVVLYCKGRFLDLNDQVCIAVVGTRRMTEYGDREWRSAATRWRRTARSTRTRRQSRCSAADSISYIRMNIGRCRSISPKRA